MGYVYFVLIMAVCALIGLIDVLIFKHKLDRESQQREEDMRQSAIDGAFLDKICAPQEEKLVLIQNIRIRRQVNDVYAELHDDLIQIFGDDYKNKFPLPGKIDKDYWGVADNEYFWAVQLLLAHRGQLDRSCASFVGGYPIGGEATKDWNIEMCKLIEAYLIKAHPEEGDNVRLYQRPQRWDHEGNLLKVQEILDPQGGICNTQLGIGYWYKNNGRRLW